jgi:hypothetical protein
MEHEAVAAPRRPARPVGSKIRLLLNTCSRKYKGRDIHAATGRSIADVTGRRARCVAHQPNLFDLQA